MKSLTEYINEASNSQPATRPVNENPMNGQNDDHSDQEEKETNE